MDPLPRAAPQAPDTKRDEGRVGAHPLCSAAGSAGSASSPCSTLRGRWLGRNSSDQPSSACTHPASWKPWKASWAGPYPCRKRLGVFSARSVAAVSLKHPRGILISPSTAAHPSPSPPPVFAVAAVALDLPPTSIFPLSHSVLLFPPLFLFLPCRRARSLVSLAIAPPPKPQPISRLDPAPNLPVLAGVAQPPLPTLPPQCRPVLTVEHAALPAQRARTAQLPKRVPAPSPCPQRRSG